MPFKTLICWKTRYDSQEDAEEQIEYLKAHDLVDEVQLRVYKCPQCYSFHLTSKPKRRR